MIGKTQIQITEPKDDKSGPGRHLAKYGPGVTHVAWGVENLRKLADDLASKGIKMRGENPHGTADGQVHKPGSESHDYRTLNIDLEHSLGVKIQLVGPA
jgi:4-hydroxyphenylpyruvate dioxygenase-like putative hemolysin